MTRTRSALPLFAATLALAALPAPTRAQDATAAAPRRTVIRAAHLIEPRTGKRIDNAVIVVDGDRITSVTSGGGVPAGATVVDLGDATVLPGLIDVHTHLSGESHDYYTDLFRHSPIDAAVRAHIYAQRTLSAGFTTVRDVGAPELIDVALRNAINEGVIAGPRMLVATLPLSATGGHGDLNGFSPYLHFQQLSNIADGVDEVRKAVRVNIKYGADWIKVLASAGVLSEEEAVGAPQYSQEELNAIVAEATTWGRKVAAHAHGAEAIKRATRAGVASIEHGGLIDEEGVRLMKEHGTYLVPDIYTDAYILEHGKEIGLPDKMIEKERQLRKAQNVNWRRAIAAGVKMAFGTDAGVYPHGTNARQFKYLLELGLTPLQTIQMATCNAADLLGWSDRVGTLVPGAWADMIAVRGDPLSDVTLLERPTFVMKGGTIYRSAPAADTAAAH
ncbi:MAG: amidohydrolase family protein [Gemmatimonadaceae bacterium]|nr:amidohydrolase family protein [Gemmatimonadaceae bacterium]